jgi:hypothetical protein
MSLKHLLSACTALLLALAVVAPGVAAGKAGGTDRPLKGSFSQTTTGDLATGTAISEGTGIFSHLGKSTIRNVGSVTLTGSTVNITGTSTTTAANGDQLFATYTGSGQVSSPVPTVGDINQFAFVATITGGTGRFSDASGTFTVDVQMEVVSFAGTTLVSHDTATIHGQISY